MLILLYENESDLEKDEPLGGTYFHMDCFAWRLVFITQNQCMGSAEIDYCANPATGYFQLPCVSVFKDVREKIV